MVFWSHSINNRTIRRINAAIVSPLRRCLALPRDANTTSILTEFGLPSFEDMRSVQTVRYIQSIRLNKQPLPVLKFFRSLRNLPDKSPLNRMLLHNTVARYSATLNCDTFDIEPLPSITATIRTNQTLTTTNKTFRAIRTAPFPAIYLSTDSPSTAATRANLRSGHRLNVWRFGKTSLTIECPDYKQPDTIDHILLHCNAYTSIRHRIDHAFYMYIEFGQTVPFNTATVLGSDDFDIDTQKKCMSISAPLINAISKRRHI